MVQCVCVRHGPRGSDTKLMDHQNYIPWGGIWATRSFTMPPHHSHWHTCTPTLSPSLISSLSLHLSRYTTTGRADGSPSARRARKSMWIKGYTQQVWRAASTVAVRQRGAPAHLPPRLGDIWLGFCGMISVLPPTTATATTTGTTPKGEAVICSVFLLANEQMSECLSVCWCVCVCIEVWEDW